MAASVLQKLWWALLIRGIASVIFGVIAIVLPGITLLTFATIFAVYALIDGFAMISGALANRTMRNWLWYLLGGIVSLLAGVFTLLNPGVTIFVFITILAVWAIAGGVAEIAFALISREETFAEDLVLILGGVLLVLFGLLLLLRPFAAVDALLTVVGFFAVFFGVMQIVLALRVRGARQKLEAGAGA